MQQLAAAAALMQVVHVLRDQQHPAAVLALQPGQRLMGSVGLDGGVMQLAAAVVVEALHQRRIARKALGCGHLLNAVVFPEPVLRAEGAHARLGRYTRTGQDYNVFILSHRPSRHNAARSAAPRPKSAAAHLFGKLPSWLFFSHAI